MPGRVLGIDYGSRRIGIAVSDPTRLLARGVGTFPNDSRFMERLNEIIAREEVTLIVVGMPFDQRGEKGTKALEVDEFIKRLKQHTSVKIDTWDESFSSVRAQQTFIDMGMKKKFRRQKSRVDVMAARIMLQEYLDAHQTRR